MRSIVFSLLIILPISLLAQDIDVKSFRALPQDLDARVNYPEIDQNGDKAALIKVVTTETGFKFEGGMLGIVKTVQKTGEVWVYVPHGSRKITIKHANLGVLRDYNFEENIKEASVYEMVLVTGKVTTIVEEIEVAAQWLVITSDPEGATVYIDEKEIGQTPFNRKFKEGDYNYRIEYPRYYPEAGKLTIEESKKQLNFSLRPRFGDISITSSPENGMKIFLDGKDTGKKTPTVLKDIDSGEHRISLQSKWYQNKTELITVQDEQTMEVEFNMLASYAEVEITTTEGASILIDGEKKGENYWSGKLLEGIYEVLATKQYHTDRSKQLDVQSGNTIRVDLSLDAETGSVDVISTPIGAKIFVDGNAYGTTPNTVKDLLCGPHTLRLEMDKYAPTERNFTIKHNETITVQETLRDGEPVYITTKPKNVAVYLDGDYKGETPITLSMGYGNFQLKFINGSETDYKHIEVKPNIRNEYNFDLRTYTQKVDESDWETATRTNSLSAYQNYLRNHPSGIYASDARRKISSIESSLDDKYYAECKASNYVEDYQNYLKKYPNGKHAKEAHTILENAYWRLGNQALENKQYTAAIRYYNLYTTDYPTGKHTTEAIANRKKAERRNSRYDSYYFNYTIQGNAPIGLSMGGLNLNQVGLYYTLNTNGNWWKYSAEVTDIVYYTVAEIESYSWKDPIAQNVFERAYFRTSMGLTYGVIYPIWIYGGAGVEYTTQFEKYYLEYDQEYQWAKNENLTYTTFYPEFGLIARLGQSWMVKYGLLFTDGGTFQEFGLGVAF